MPDAAESGTDRVGQYIPQHTQKRLGRAQRVFQVIVIPESTRPPEKAVRLMRGLTLERAECLRGVLLLTVETAGIDRAVDMVRHDAITQKIVLYTILLPQRIGKHGYDWGFREPFGADSMLPELPIKFLQAFHFFLRTYGIFRWRFDDSGKDLLGGVLVLQEFAKDVGRHRSCETQGGETSCGPRMMQLELNAMGCVVR